MVGQKKDSKIRWVPVNIYYENSQQKFKVYTEII